METFIKDIPIECTFISYDLDVKYYNEIFDQDYNYYFMQFENEQVVRVWGSYSMFNDKLAFPVPQSLIKLI